MSAPYVLVPVTITDTMLTSSTAAEPGAGETVWNAATSYTVGQECILTATHRVYTNQIAGVDAISPNLSLAGATPRWKDTRATNKWACYDNRSSYQTELVTPLTMVLRPGIFNGMVLYGLDGAALSISAKTAPGGSVFFTYASDLTEPPIDQYDYYFGRIKPLSKALCPSIVPYADPEVTISITAAAGVTVKAGKIAIGDLRQLLTVDGTGGTQYGATAKAVSLSYMGLDSAGQAVVKSRTKGTNMDIRIMVPRTDSDSVLATLQDVLDVPCAWVGCDLANFSGLSSFGLASGGVSYDGPSHSVISLQVTGLL